MFGSKQLLVVALVAAAALATGCAVTTKAAFRVPKGAVLKVNDKPVTLADDGTAELKAFGWGASKGVSYTVTRGEKVVMEGELETAFRAMSIFWPPFAVLYAPYELAKTKYDLTAPKKSS